MSLEAKEIDETEEVKDLRWPFRGEAHGMQKPHMVLIGHTHILPNGQELLYYKVKIIQVKSKNKSKKMQVLGILDVRRMKSAPA